MQAIETRSLVKAFDGTRAVDGINLQVEAGSIYGFLGPNGAGKSTTIRLLLGLLRPTSGDIDVLGLSMPAQRRAIARSVGALVETPCHYDHLTGIENLDISRRLLGLRPQEVARVLELVDLAHAARQRVRGYSLGMRQRLGIARALLGSPRLLLLDEPTNGLDPDGIAEIRRLMRLLPERDGTTLLVSSHLLAEVEQVATHVGLMWKGQLVAQGRLADTLGAGSPWIELHVDDPLAAERLLARSGHEVTPGPNGRLEVRRRGGADPGAVNALLTGSSLVVSHLALRRPSLEELYFRMTGGRVVAGNAGSQEAFA